MIFHLDGPARLFQLPFKRYRLETKTVILSYQGKLYGDDKVAFMIILLSSPNLQNFYITMKKFYSKIPLTNHDQYVIIILLFKNLLKGSFNEKIKKKTKATTN